MFQTARYLSTDGREPDASVAEGVARYLVALGQLGGLMVSIGAQPDWSGTPWVDDLRPGRTPMLERLLAA